VSYQIYETNPIISTGNSFYYVNDSIISAAIECLCNGDSRALIIIFDRNKSCRIASQHPRSSGQRRHSAILLAHRLFTFDRIPGKHPHCQRHGYSSLQSGRLVFAQNRFYLFGCKSGPARREHTYDEQHHPEGDHWHAGKVHLHI
jgi:hypothetical protein